MRRLDSNLDSSDVLIALEGCPGLGFGYGFNATNRWPAATVASSGSDLWVKNRAELTHRFGHRVPRLTSIDGRQW